MAVTLRCPLSPKEMIFAPTNTVHCSQLEPHWILLVSPTVNIASRLSVMGDGYMTARETDRDFPLLQMCSCGRVANALVIGENHSVTGMSVRAFDCQKINPNNIFFYFNQNKAG